MTSCERATTLFGSAWDDELTATERDGLERHIEACGMCRREYDEFARTLELVQALPRPQVDEGFAGRVLTAALAREAAAASVGRRLFAFPAAWSVPAFGRPALALAATFIVAVGVGAFLLSRPLPGPADVATVPATPAPIVATLPPPPPVEAPAQSPRAEVQAQTRRLPAASSIRVATPRVAPSTALAAAPGIADSLFDHTADVELILDPGQLRRERGRGYTPASPPGRGEAGSSAF
jgi:hypothetical protein